MSIELIRLIGATRIRELTIQARNAVVPAPVEVETEFSPHALEVFDKIKNSFGCNRGAVYNLVTALLGEPMPPLPQETARRTWDVQPILGAAYHSSDLDCVLVLERFDSDDDGVIAYSTGDGSSTYAYPNSLTPATDEQLEALFRVANIT